MRSRVSDNGCDRLAVLFEVGRPDDVFRVPAINFHASSSESPSSSE